MASIVQFRMSLGEFVTINFTGDHISVFDLKKIILEKKKFSKAQNFDFIITDTDSNITYESNSQVPRNTRVNVKRQPISGGGVGILKLVERAPDTIEPRPKEAKEAAPPLNPLAVAVPVEPVVHSTSSPPPGTSVKEADLRDENDEKRITEIMNPTHQPFPPQQRTHFNPPKPGYICNNCGIPGHWKQQCPAGRNYAGAPIIMQPQPVQPVVGRKINGVPTIFLNPSGGQRQVDSTGNEDSKVVAAKDSGTLDFALLETLPAEFRCLLSRRDLRAAVLLPCCGARVDEKSVESRLRDSGEKCPLCHRPCRLGDLTECPDLRKQIDDFLSTGALPPPPPPVGPPPIVSRPMGTVPQSLPPHLIGGPPPPFVPPTLMPNPVFMPSLMQQQMMMMMPYPMQQMIQQMSLQLHGPVPIWDQPPLTREEFSRTQNYQRQLHAFNEQQKQHAGSRKSSEQRQTSADDSRPNRGTAPSYHGGRRRSKERSVERDRDGKVDRGRDNDSYHRPSYNNGSYDRFDSSRGGRRFRESSADREKDNISREKERDRRSDAESFVHRDSINAKFEKDKKLRGASPARSNEYSNSRPATSDQSRESKEDYHRREASSSDHHRDSIKSEREGFKSDKKRKNREASPVRNVEALKSHESSKSSKESKKDSKDSSSKDKEKKRHKNRSESPHRPERHPSPHRDIDGGSSKRRVSSVVSSVVAYSTSHGKSSGSSRDHDDQHQVKRGRDEKSESHVSSLHRVVAPVASSSSKSKSDKSDRWEMSSSSKKDKDGSSGHSRPKESNSRR